MDHDHYIVYTHGTMVKLISQPTVRHEALDTTFIGIEHPLSTAANPIHQFRGIKYAYIPARWRQSKLYTSYAPGTDATKYGSVRHVFIFHPTLTSIQANMSTDAVQPAYRGPRAGAAARFQRVRMLEPQHHLPRKSHAHVPSTSHGLGAWVSRGASCGSVTDTSLTTMIVEENRVQARVGYMTPAPSSSGV